MKLQRNIDNIIIILIFALLHSAVAMISRALHYYDDIPLTILTITMVIVISMRNNTRVEMMAIMTLTATIIGYITGTWLRDPMLAMVQNEYIAPAISTFLITTLIGLFTNYTTVRSKRFKNTSHRFAITPKNIIITALSILVLRMVYIVMDRMKLFTDGMIFSSIIEIIGNSWALLLLLASNIVLVMHIVHRRYRNKHHHRLHRTLLIIATIAIPAITATLAYYDIPYFESRSRGIEAYVRILSAALLLDFLTLAICYLVLISLHSRRELREEREQKHRTEYQYERLKQQINPHFLFNSLGILDYLVQEHETERASAFIRKLAGIYRYMLNNDQKPLVKLSEELEFTSKYIDLLKERFTEGMLFEIDIKEGQLDTYVVPCALQLLVENATKHNIVSGDSPLVIRIATEGEYTVVRNNLQLRTHGQPSTHLGLANIQRQYLDITGRDIIIEKTDSEFIVKLPIA